MADLKKQYHTVMNDHFPLEISLTLGDTVLRYRKRTWKLPDEQGNLEEKGLRYGENPGQEAALYQLAEGCLRLGQVELVDPQAGMVSALTEEQMLQAGKHPGKTNFTDVDNALNIMRYFPENRPAAAIMKHNNPSGAAYGQNIAQAYERAFLADLIAAFGGAAVFNRPLDKTTAELMGELYLEVVAAPDYEEGVLDILKKWKNLRILRLSRLDRLWECRDWRFLDIKSLLDGGLIVQTSGFNPIRGPEDFLPAQSRHQNREYNTQRKPTDRELDDAVFGWAVEQGVTSNSVLYVKDGCTIGVGAGEQDRVGVARIAVHKAYEKYANRLCWQKHHLKLDELKDAVARKQKDPGLLAEIQEETRRRRAGLPGSVMISDAFFPFRDGVDVGLEQGVSCIVHPGGGIRDWESIEACNQADPPAAMVFTGQRAFKH